MNMNASARWWLFLRLAVATVWLYQGLWLKVIAVDARHLAIVAAASAMLPPRLALAGIGVFETLFGIADFASAASSIAPFTESGRSSHGCSDGRR